MIQVNGRNYDYIIDVRSQEEFHSDHFAGALNHDTKDVLIGHYPNISTDAKIGLYCRSGNRSEIVKEILLRNGYANVDNLGGLKDVGL